MLLKMKILVLGAGLVGRPMALDLANDAEYKVDVADANDERLKKLKGNPAINTLRLDAGDEKKLKRTVQSYDLIVNALPGFLGYRVTKWVIESGINLVDISFFPEDPEPLEKLAIEKNITAMIDCGVAPGMSYILAGFAHYQLIETQKIRIYVGGLPVIRNYPFEYKAVFSPVDVIEEYTRPARYVKGGQIIVMPALSEAELIDFPNLGTLEAFNTDGLRSMLKNIPCPDMVEKTLRYPGHISKIQFLKDCGFFSEELIDYQGIKIRPLDFTSQILFPLWKLNEHEKDLTIMTVIVEGISGHNGEKIRKIFRWDLLDTYDEKTGIHSMARTTGYTATAAVRMLTSGIFRQKGLIYPEFIGKYPECVAFMLEYLKKRGVNYISSTEETLLPEN